MGREIESRQGIGWKLFKKTVSGAPWQRSLVITSPPATKETGAMGREIESLLGYVG
jgi:hypothetical protein